MPQTYKLPCPSCEKSLPITTPQAGETLACECGANVQVPTLREIRQLDPIDDISTAGKSDGNGWNARKGIIFVAGTVMIVLGLIGHLRLNPQRQALSTEAPPFEELNVAIESISPVEAWAAWDYFRRQDLEYRDTPEFLANREKHFELTIYVYACWALAAAGLGMVVASILIPNRQ